MNKYKELLAQMRNFAELVSDRKEEKTLIEKVLSDQRKLSEEENKKMNQILFPFVRESGLFIKLSMALGKVYIPPEEKLWVSAEIESIGRILIGKDRMDLLVGIGVTIEKLGGNPPKEFSELTGNWLKELFNKSLESKQPSPSNRETVLGELQVLEAEKIIRNLE